MSFQNVDDIKLFYLVLSVVYCPREVHSCPAPDHLCVTCFFFFRSLWNLLCVINLKFHSDFFFCHLLNLFFNKG